MSSPFGSAAAVLSSSSRSPSPPSPSNSSLASNSQGTVPAALTSSPSLSGISVPISTPRKTVRFQTDVNVSTLLPEPVRRSKSSLKNYYTSSHASHALHGSRSSHSHPHATTTENHSVVHLTLLQPRVAIILGLPSFWHLPLFACRLLSVCPAIWWSLGIATHLLVQLRIRFIVHGGVATGSGGIRIHDCTALSLESRLEVTETALAMIWCGASAYLSFFFTDCLMSRWLLNYTPQATIVRLMAINALNGYLTSCIIHLAGSGGDLCLLLPTWVAIAGILSALQHLTQRKINIRKETGINISVFSGASFISMVSLLTQLYWERLKIGL